jgi:hypothetical protein
MPDSPINYDVLVRWEAADGLAGELAAGGEAAVIAEVLEAIAARFTAEHTTGVRFSVPELETPPDSDGREEAVVEEGTPEWWAEEVEEVVGRDEEAGEELVVTAPRQVHSRRRVHEAAGEYREAYELWGTSLVDAWADRARFREAEERLRRAVAGLAPAEGE